MKNHLIKFQTTLGEDNKVVLYQGHHILLLNKFIASKINKKIFNKLSSRFLNASINYYKKCTWILRTAAKRMAAPKKPKTV